MKSLMRVMSCSCGQKFSTPWEIYSANDYTLTVDQKEDFVEWLVDHAAPSHVKSLSLVEAPPRGN
jgi:hypothetical protein